MFFQQINFFNYLIFLVNGFINQLCKYRFFKGPCVLYENEQYYILLCHLMVVLFVSMFVFSIFDSRDQVPWVHDQEVRPEIPQDLLMEIRAMRKEEPQDNVIGGNDVIGEGNDVIEEALQDNNRQIQTLSKEIRVMRKEVQVMLELLKYISSRQSGQFQSKECFNLKPNRKACKRYNLRPRDYQMYYYGMDSDSDNRIDDPDFVA